MEEKDIILSKWLSGKASDDEVRATLGDVDLDYLRSLMEVQDRLEISATDPMSRWDQLEAKIDDKLSSAEVVSKETNVNIETASSAPSRIKIWIILGVVLFGLGMVALLLFSNNETVVKAPANEFLIYAFEDGSETRIWPGSEIRYDESSYLSDRQVTLAGQAFFEVEKGASFVVTTSTGTVEVLGTSFDVWSMDDDNMDVTCHTGRVQVSDRNKNSKVLTRGDRVLVENSKIGEVTSVDLSNYDATSELKQYDNAKISWVIDDLERIYGKRIDIDKRLLQERFSGVVSTNNLSRTLTYLCETMQWEYEEKGAGINISDKE